MSERRPHARSFTCVTSLTKTLAQMVKLSLRDRVTSPRCQSWLK